MKKTTITLLVIAALTACTKNEKSECYHCDYTYMRVNKRLYTKMHGTVRAWDTCNVPANAIAKMQKDSSRIVWRTQEDEYTYTLKCQIAE